MISIYEAVHKFINNVNFDRSDCHSDYLTVEYAEKYHALKYKNTILLLNYKGVLYRDVSHWGDSGTKNCFDIVRICLNDHGNPHADTYTGMGMEKFIEYINAKCSLCNIDREKTKTLVKIQKGYICDECIKLSVPIIQNYNQKEYKQDIQELNFRL